MDEKTRLGLSLLVSDNIDKISSNQPVRQTALGILSVETHTNISDGQVMGCFCADPD